MVTTTPSQDTYTRGKAKKVNTVEKLVNEAVEITIACIKEAQKQFAAERKLKTRKITEAEMFLLADMLRISAEV